MSSTKIDSKRKISTSSENTSMDPQNNKIRKMLQNANEPIPVYKPEPKKFDPSIPRPKYLQNN